MIINDLALVMKIIKFKQKKRKKIIKDYNLIFGKYKF